MRWLDITLPSPGTHRNLDTALEEARARAADLLPRQERDGLDALSVTRCMEETGQLLFRAVTTADPAAFAPEGTAAAAGPPLGDAEHDGLTGYHLVVPDAWRDLPWNWLHNGLEHLLEKHPLCWSDHGAGPPAEAPRPWMQRLVRAAFLVGPGGGTDLRHTLAQLRAEGPARPRLLFVAGHSDEAMRRLIYREAEAIAASLAGSPLGSALARLEVPAGAVTPTRLREQALAYQAIHYAGPTSMPPALADAKDDRWLEELIADVAARGASPDEALDDALGLEEMPVGVDQVTALLDAVSERAARHPGAAEPPSAPTATATESPRPGAPRPWLLEDGPVRPEGFGKGGGMPPLVYSNHHLALRGLGARFTGAGASTVVGPVAPVYSRPARRFTGHVYRALGEGWCVGAAVWRAAAALRGELGADHPGWLSYGVQGYGTLALQYL